jgi:hypothetical protein
MTRVKQVETAIGETDALALQPPPANPFESMRQRDQLVPLVMGIARRSNFARLSDRGAELAHDDAGRDIGKTGGLMQAGTRRDRRCNGCDHRIAGAGHVRHFARHRRQVRGFVSRYQQHSFFAQGNEERTHAVHLS